jgi:putative ABC transport system permease protein
MTGWSGFISRVRHALTRRRREAELDAEVQMHLDLLTDAYARGGLTDEEARQKARREFGVIEPMRQAYRDQLRFTPLADLGNDALHGLRTLRRSPIFTAVVLLTLAIGIGANTAIFSVVNGVILRPLGYTQPERLMFFKSQFPALTAWTELATPEYEVFRDTTRSFAHVGAFMTGEVNLATGDRPLRVRSARVDEHLLATLGFRPAQGRLFAAGETDAQGAVPTIAILSHELWSTAFGGQPVVGRTVPIDGRPHEILGVMPRGADVMDNRTEIWLPLGLDDDFRLSPDAHLLSVVGRLKDGVTVETARIELTAFVDSWQPRKLGTGTQRHALTNRPSGGSDHALALEPVQNAIVGDAGRSIWILQVAVGFVLLVACANLANLFIVRSESRRREFALRAALGASRARLLRQTITESLLLAVVGGLIGLWVAAIGVRGLLLAYPTSVPRMNDVGIDVSVLLFTLVLSVVTGVVFGVAPSATRRVRDLVTVLKEGGHRGPTSAGRQPVRSLLVVAEIALAVVLVTGASLLLRTVYNLASVDAGFDRSLRVTFSMTLPSATTEPDTRALAYHRLLDKLRGLPGVEAATAMTALPFRESGPARGTRIENYTSATGQPWEIVFHQRVMSDYFPTMGIPIVAGRAFDPADVASPGGVVVINERLAKLVWNERSPIGQRLRPNFTGMDVLPWHTVIGVAKDVRQDGVTREASPQLYVLAEEQAHAPPTMHVVLRTTLPVAALLPTIERSVKEVDPTVPIVRLRELDAVFAESIRRPRLLAQLLVGFGGLALLLAAVGTYGMLSWMVTERRREIGIRLALGADRTRILAMIMKHGSQLTIIGVLVGLACAVGLNRLLTSVLFGVTPTDTTTVIAVVATISLVAVVACWLPAVRASRVDPNVVLRTD